MSQIEGVAHVLCLWDDKGFASYNSWVIPRGNHILKSLVTAAGSSGGKVQTPSEVKPESCLNLG